MPIHTISRYQNTLYTSKFGSGIEQSEACCSLNHYITTSLGLRCTPKKTKSTPDLHRPNNSVSVRVNTYAYSQHIKVPKTLYTSNMDV